MNLLGDVNHSLSVHNGNMTSKIILEKLNTTYVIKAAGKDCQCPLGANRGQISFTKYQAPIYIYIHRIHYTQVRYNQVKVVMYITINIIASGHFLIMMNIW